jgi:hypothetical protein
MIQTGKSAPIPPDKGKLIIKIINRQKYYQYHLQEHYGSNPMPLSVDQALLWRQQSAGELTACFAEVANIQCGIDPQQGNSVKGVFYWLGASLQLVDDVVDIHSDLTTHAQSSLRSCLIASGEIDRVTKWFGDHKATVIPFSRLRMIAPVALRMIQSARQSYYQQIPQTENYRWVRFIADPSHFQIIYYMYSVLSSAKTKQG